VATPPSPFEGLLWTRHFLQYDAARAHRTHQLDVRALSVLLLGGIIENQNSDFVMQRKLIYAFLHDEVLIFIFDDPAEQEDGQLP
jgi:hypothetical protein